MNVVSGVAQIKTKINGSVVLIGNFDGLHLGHRQLLASALKMARTLNLPVCVYTFYPHPMEVLQPTREHKSLFPREDLQAQLALLGVDHLIVEPFDQKFAQIKAEEFVIEYLGQFLRPQHVIIGEGFMFGRKREGNTSLLQQMGEQEGFTVEVVPPQKFHERVISTSWIKETLREGQMELAAQLLGRFFYLSGTVVKGEGRGSKKLVPTANLDINKQVLPKDGVYLTAVPQEGRYIPAVTNVGVNPTFHQGEGLPKKIETHILDQNLDLLGSTLQIHFISYIREERRFASAQDLHAQIKRDIEQARTLWRQRQHEMGGHRA